MFEKDDQEKTFVIAEAGANHDRNLQQAYQLIKVAADAGADAVKFQTYSSETLYSKFTPDFAGYKKIPELIKSIELPREWHSDLKKCCDDHGIEFMSTPFDLPAIDQLFELGVKRLKISGFEATDPRIVRHAAKTGLPLIITKGIGCDVVTVGKIIDHILKENSAPDVTFLHGNNAYPTPHEEAYLDTITTLRKMKYQIPIKVGLSDHTEGVVIPPLAVMLGAQVIEKHFTISRKLEGPDHPFAVEPNELKEMVRNIRIAERARGTKPGTSESEKPFSSAKRSLVVLADIKKGETLTFDNITTKRPAISGCVSARDYYDMLENGNIVATKDLEQDKILVWNDITTRGLLG